ncbi:hypothetical protein [Tabrizicola sp.]|jgi:hypothetical protein|uniref:hypothetical protein n=1 Tax=Tabrizicola sp. TaxID=2005166 RepID=UPI001A5DBA08|nr:hypothetical protein [Tabrizicola sp.]MBL9063700.1 hypothetical protein [Tabrizicola sp.]
MTQLLIQTSAPDYTAWKAAFDAEAENIAAASLNTLQIWKGDGNAVLVLFEVADRKNAQAWLDKQAAFGRGYRAEFLETA